MQEWGHILINIVFAKQNRCLNFMLVERPNSWALLFVEFGIIGKGVFAN